MTEKTEKHKKPGREIGGIGQWGVFGSEDEDTSMPGEQLTSKPVKQHDSKTASQDDSKLMKGTYYIKPEQDLKLERIRLARRAQGQKVDKSALIREAIDLLKET